jgi:hypothetical protein
VTSHVLFQASRISKDLRQIQGTITPLRSLDNFTMPSDLDPSLELLLSYSVTAALRCAKICDLDGTVSIYHLVGI